MKGKKNAPVNKQHHRKAKEKSAHRLRCVVEMKRMFLDFF